MVLLTRPRLRTLAVDGTLAALLGAIMVGPYYSSAVAPIGPPDTVAFALIWIVIAALPFRRLLPTAAFGTTSAVLAIYLGLGYPDGPIILAVPITVYTVGTCLAIRRSLPACGLSSVVLTFADAGAWSRWSEWLGPVMEWVVIFGLAPWAVGTIMRMDRKSAHAAQAEAQRDRTYQERLRTAHDVHDIVGHGLAAISMQAGVALHVLDRSPDKVREILVAIRASSRDALDELRATLAVFHSPEDETAPPPGLDRLDVLVNRAVGAGLPVHLVRDDELGRLPVSVEVAAYRIVQESLTNALRHAGPATATVRIGRCADELVVEVVDTGCGRVTGAADGQGIVGMRARAESVGGVLDAGPDPAGGFAVRARLPVAGVP